MPSASRFHCCVARDSSNSSSSCTFSMLSTVVMLAVLLGSSTVFGVSGSPASSATSAAAAAPNKSDSDSISIQPVLRNSVRPSGDGRNADGQSSLTSPAAVAAFLARQAGAALARYFGTADGESGVGESRTFFIRRLQKKLMLGLIPIAFKAGILTVAIFTILLVAVKSLLIGKLLLILNLGYILAKLVAWKTGSNDHHEHFSKSWSPPASSANDIHLHIHNAAPAIYPVATSSSHHDLPYGAHVPQLQQRGPSIHIEPAPAYGSYAPPAYDSSWSSNNGGYQRREQTGNEYAYVDQSGIGGTSASAFAQQQQFPTYIPNARFTNQ